jgi:hypothetical protein
MECDKMRLLLGYERQNDTDPAHNHNKENRENGKESVARCDEQLLCGTMRRMCDKRMKCLG